MVFFRCLPFSFHFNKNGDGKISQILRSQDGQVFFTVVQVKEKDDGPESKFRDTIHNMEHRHAQAQLELQRQQDHIDSLQTQINDDFGLADIEFGENTTIIVSASLADG